VRWLKVKKKEFFSSSLFFLPLVAGILLSFPKKALCKDQPSPNGIKCTIETCINERKTWVLETKYGLSNSDKILKEYTVATAELPLVYRLNIKKEFKPLPIISLTGIGIEFATGSGVAKAEHRVVEELVITHGFGDIITKERTVQTTEFNTSLNNTSIFLEWTKNGESAYVQLSYNGNSDRETISPGISFGLGAKFSYDLTKKITLKINISFDTTTDNFITAGIAVHTKIGEFYISALPIQLKSNRIEDVSLMYNFLKFSYSYTFGTR